VLVENTIYRHGYEVVGTLKYDHYKTTLLNVGLQRH
jgi:hypothetical protein